MIVKLLWIKDTLCRSSVNQKAELYLFFTTLLILQIPIHHPSGMNNKKQAQIPYGRQQIDPEDIQGVVDVLLSDWITTGPAVDAFEKALSDFTGAGHAVAVSSGTAALHTAMHCAGIQQGDEVIVPAMTFAATANAVVFQGGIPIFADVDSETLLIDFSTVEALITPDTKAVVAVDYAGQPCDYNALNEVVRKHGLILIVDACHSIGAEYMGRKTGTMADMTVFSFHPVKHITTGEGGAVVTDNPEYAAKARKFRNHGISTDHRQRSDQQTWFYTMDDLGYNYRITDFQCALGTSQLKKLSAWIAKRHAIATLYTQAFKPLSCIEPLKVNKGIKHAFHLYVIKLLLNEPEKSRSDLFAILRNRGIGVNVHYIPVHLHPFYKKRFNCRKGDCPVAEAAYEQILSLPIFPSMTDEQSHGVIDAVTEALIRY